MEENFSEYGNIFETIIINGFYKNGFLTKVLNIFNYYI